MMLPVAKWRKAVSRNFVVHAVGALSIACVALVTQAQTPAVGAAEPQVTSPGPATPPQAGPGGTSPQEAAPLPPETGSPNASSPPETPLAETPPIDFGRYLANDKIDYAGLAVEKATIQKTLADELYLRGDRQGSEQAYQRTLATLTNEAPDDKLNANQQAVKKLLKVDVEYRLLNLRLGNDFWSGYRTDRPSTPHKHMLVLEAATL